MDVDEFIARWTAREGGAERASYQMFLSEICDVLGVPHLDPAGPNSGRNEVATPGGHNLGMGDQH